MDHQIFIALGLLLVVVVLTVVIVISQKKRENYEDSPRGDLLPASVLWRKIGEKACKNLLSSCNRDPSVDCNAFSSDLIVTNRAVQQRALVFADLPENAGQETTFTAMALANTMSRLYPMLRSNRSLRDPTS